MKEIIRKAKQKDSEKILDLFNQNTELTCDESLNYNKNHVREFLSSYKTFICEIDKKVAGILITQWGLKGKFVYIDSLIVNPNYRKKGIATKLLNYLKKSAKQKGINLLFLFSEINNKKAQNLFKKNNYKRGKKFYFYSKTI